MLNLLSQVESIAKEVGQHILLPAFISQTSIQSRKSDGSIVTETDEKAQTFIQQALHDIHPNIGFLGEEMSKAEQQQALDEGGKFWCVDPLDGTGNFTTPMPLFAISIALIADDKPVLACIYDPVRDEIFSATRGNGLSINGESYTPIPVNKPLNDCIGFVDFKRLQTPLAIKLVTKKHYRSQRNIGTCALEWAWLAAGRAQFIVHGGQKLWDYAAGLLLAEEAACTVTDFAGNHPFAQSRLSCPILATSNTDLSQAWLSLVDEKA
ncbi:inositol monophosphatase family protein [Ghiorsea bivora]|uniref:inositol monophosphatase family protein n=1 Tax=Ghiorsea bivora TaxID=1485545 RepID=UPI00056E835D|nr:inositol monophosphatase family protein [Ghiorsea bivora]